MKASKFSLVLVLIIGTILVSFSLDTSRSIQTSNRQIKSIALISTMIGKIVQPDIPLMDAGPFNKKTNSIASLIIEQEMKSIDGFREAVASSLKKQFNCDVYYGSSLVTKPEYIEITKMYNFPDSLNVINAYNKNKYFPKIIIPNDEKNLFNYTNGEVINYMNNKDVAKNIITSTICKLLGTDLVAVSYSTLSVEQVGMFGRNADLSLTSYIFIFDKEGRLVAKGDNQKLPQAVIRHHVKESLKIVGDDVADYKTVLNTLPDILPKLMAKVSEKLVGK